MKEIFTITNQKGGIGKSTTAHAIGAGLARKQNKTLLVDLDAQANLTLAAGADPSRPTILELMQQTAAAGDVIQPVRENLDILPASMNLSAADLLFHDTGKEYRLKEALAPLLGQYDYLVLDTPPALGVLTVNALTVATKVIIPAQADLFSLSAIQRLYGTIETVKKYTNPSLQIEGIVLTRYNPRNILTKELTDLIQDTAAQIRTKVFQTPIREAIAIKEAQASHTDIFTYAPKSKVAQDYQSLLEEILQDKGGKAHE